MEAVLKDSKYRVPKLSYGDVVEGLVIAKKRGELLLDIGAKSEGIISGRELEDEFNTFGDVNVGDRIPCFVVQAENDQGFVVLSLRRASSFRKWDQLEQLFAEGRHVEVEVTDYNRGGLVVRLKSGDQGFVPLTHFDPRHLRGRDTSDLSFLSGQKLTVKIIEVDRERARLVLSERAVVSEEGRAARLKRLKTIKEGQKVKGVISAVQPYGVFVDLGDGLEGFIHQSEFSWEHSPNSDAGFKVGQPLEAAVFSVSPAEEKVSLSLRALEDDPWEGVEEEFEPGQKVVGEVTKIAPFGAFVRVKDNLEGLIHLSEATGPLKVGQKVEAVVINVDGKERKIGLSIKRLAQ